MSVHREQGIVPPDLSNVVQRQQIQVARRHVRFSVVLEVLVQRFVAVIIVTGLPVRSVLAGHQHLLQIVVQDMNQPGLITVVIMILKLLLIRGYVVDKVTTHAVIHSLNNVAIMLTRKVETHLTIAVTSLLKNVANLLVVAR